MPTSTVGQRVEHAHLAFTLAVQHALTGTGTTCWSPYSVSSALGLVATGARGATRDELTSLLVGPAGGSLLDNATLLTRAASLMSGGTGQPPELGVANTLWTNENLPIEPAFRSELAAWPNGAVRNAPFEASPDSARQLINDDVARTTRGLIRELIPHGVLTASTVAALVNALYLKVAWRNQFPASGTRPRPFHGPDSTAEVPTMRLDKRLGYAAVGDWQVVELPAAGGVEAVVLLPDGPLPPAEAALDADMLDNLLTAPTPAQLHLYLPTFRVRARADLNRTLGDLGVTTMFTPDADFGGISNRRLAVDAVLHEAVLTIDEDGLEGAAATAIGVRTLSLTRDLSVPIEVRVDRPFLFLVRHKESGAVYFLARVVSP
jgi:serine protease inhibitor